MVVSRQVTPLPFHQAVRALVGCAAATIRLIAEGRISQPPRNFGRTVRFGDGTRSKVYRETVVDHVNLSAPAVLIIGFRLRHVRSGWAHHLFRLESELNTVLFAGFPGFVSKLWLCHDEQGLYRGVYQWDDPELAVAYVRALWWVLAVVSVRESIRYAVLPGRYRDDILNADELIAVASGGDEWWRPARCGRDATSSGCRRSA